MQCIADIFVSFLTLNIFASLAAYERQLLLERQRDGIAIAKQNGKYKGRSYVRHPINFKECFEKYQKATKENPYTFKQFQHDTKLASNTLIRMIRECKKDAVPEQRAVDFQRKKNK